MANTSKQRLTPDRPVVYQIKVPGHISESWQDWLGDICVENDLDAASLPITILTGKMDQAALLGLLRRLYTFGLPLISVNYLEG